MYRYRDIWLFYVLRVLLCDFMSIDMGKGLSVTVGLGVRGGKTALPVPLWAGSYSAITRN